MESMKSTSLEMIIQFCTSKTLKVHTIFYLAYASIQNNTFIVSGEPETKTIRDLLPEIIQQLGPKQHRLLQELVSNLPQTEEAPNLVEETKPQNGLNEVE